MPCPYKDLPLTTSSTKLQGSDIGASARSDAMARFPLAVTNGAELICNGSRNHWPGSRNNLLERWQQ